jgi:hypothetical protein
MGKLRWERIVDRQRLTKWLGEERVRGRTTARIGRRGEEFVAEFPNLGTFFANADGTRTHLEPALGANPVLLEKLGASAIDALVRHLRGKLTFHGAAASLDSAAIVFAGESGAGKSTLVAALCAEDDFDLVADDTASVEIPESLDSSAAIEVVPTQSAVWLLPSARAALGFDEGRAGKVPLTPRPTTAGRLFLAGIVHLVFDPHSELPVLRRVRGQDAFALLSSSVIRFIIDRPEAQLNEFEQLRSLIQRCPVFQLQRSRDLNQLRRSVDAVRQLFPKPDLSPPFG